MDSGKFYLPFDRVFTKPGFGTVVTGTLRAGSLAVGDGAEVPDLGLAVKVRRLEVHGAEAQRAMPGQRVAVNLRVDGGAKLVRGQSLSSPDWFAPSEWWTATLRMADDVETSLKNGKPVRLLHGTREDIVTLRLLDRDVLHPGESAIVQFKLTRDVCLGSGPLCCQNNLAGGDGWRWSFSEYPRRPCKAI